MFSFITYSVWRILYALWIIVVNKFTYDVIIQALLCVWFHIEFYGVYTTSMFKTTKLKIILSYENRYLHENGFL